MMELKWYKGARKGVVQHETQDPSSSISSLTQGISPRYPTSIQGQPQSTREKLAFLVGRVSLALRPVKASTLIKQWLSGGWERGHQSAYRIWVR